VTERSGREEEVILVRVDDEATDGDAGADADDAEGEDGSGGEDGSEGEDEGEDESEDGSEGEDESEDGSEGEDEGEDESEGEGRGGGGGGEAHEHRIVAWKNFCMHEPDQRLDRGVGRGAAMRDGEIICPRHGSMFDAATGYCDNGEAAGQSLVGVDVAVRDGTVYLTDEGLRYAHAGGIDEDDGPSSTSHISF
jgi:nitrite reductase/ring-hydroxylating ferredoxin subunit